MVIGALLACFHRRAGDRLARMQVMIRGAGGNPPMWYMRSCRTTVLVVGIGLVIAVPLVLLFVG
jgi:hypothetical protein